MSDDETADPHATYLQYAGISGGTADCVDAVERLLLPTPRLRSALILTDRTTNSPSHALLLTTHNGDQTVIKSGFSSGYGGTGPKGLSHILNLLSWHHVELEEVEVEPALFERLEGSALTVEDLETVLAMNPIRPRRLWDYILKEHADSQTNPWRHSELLIPMAIIDDRLAEAARDFWADPDGTLMKGFRQLEETIRIRINLTLDEATEGPAATLRKAFNGSSPKLTWPNVSTSEHAGRMNLFMGWLNAYRHVRAHRSDKCNKSDQLCELLLLNHLFRLEAEAVPKGRL